LPSSIQIDDLLKLKTAEEVPRPLINMFRIGMGINTFDEFKEVLNELVENGGKRSSANAKLNEKVNKHITEVWGEYDQKMQITVEQSQIRIEIFDPKRVSDAEFYEFQERSQGCKTFLSFILTIGAESKTNIIRNHLLLLDEPESHLHPSGQRFMLKELINISKNNQVIYATHSNHMIIRDNYDQHLIVNKDKDVTRIVQSQKKRVGYFMQEEVLYDAMGVDLSSDLSTIEDFNFVFEGLGDVILFKHYYDKILKAADRPFKVNSTKFYQGGKCSDIKKAFIKRPIQLGTKWVFLIDADEPADGLKKFLTGKYKPYIDKDIFVYQYPKVDKVGELEDLLPECILTEAYSKSFDSLDIEYEKAELEGLISKNYKKGYSNYSEIIKETYLLSEVPEFNSFFKETLNMTIGTKCSKTNKVGTFQSVFGQYFKFSNQMIKEIKGKITQKK